MKNHLRTLLALTLAALFLCSLTVCFTSCREAPTAMIDPVEEDDEEEYVTRPTVEVPEGQLTFVDLMKYHDETMAWSTLEPFTHTMLDDNTARFAVADTYGKECTLTVKIDHASGNLTEAILSYGDASSSILTVSSACFYPILYAMEGVEIQE